MLLSFLGQSQVISVTPTASADMSNLINNSLLNSTCAAATNVTSSTGTNFGSTNGIGSFTNTNPNFPISNGIILTTGSAASAAGPNGPGNTTQSNGNVAGWVGNSNLETALGLPSNSTVNATSITFNFTPISSQFSFDFVFASEEYGQFQCNFSDAFTFLLTNTNTGVTTNLAVVPGTTTPISVSTIRDTQYNAACPSVNANFFDNYYGGTTAGISPTNFNGQTKLLNASATLTPGVPYTITLVIADGINYESDSAIFISGTSFNIGQDVLGPDLLESNNTAICYGDNYTINTGLNPADYTFKWGENGAAPTPGGSTYAVTYPGGVYKVVYLKNGSTCPPETYEVKIEYFPEIIPSPPVDIYRCSSATAPYTYNIGQNTPIVLSGITGSAAATTQVTYYILSSDADTKTNPIGNSYTGLSNTTIYVRIENTITKCYVVKNFMLLLAPPPTSTAPGTLTDCESSSGSNNANFNFSSQTPTVLNGQSSNIYSVLYYDTQAHATAGGSLGLLPDNGSMQPDGKTIFIRVQNTTDSSCFDATKSFIVNVNPRPDIVDIVKEQIVCVGYTLPALSAGVQYWTDTSGTGTQLFAGDVVTNILPFLKPQTIYLYAPSLCTPPVEKSFKVIVIDLDILNPKPTPQCGEYILPSIEYASYWTGSGGTGTQLQPGDKIITTQTIYLYYVATDPPFCVKQESFTLTIEPLPVLAPYNNVFRCAGETYTLPALVQPATGTIGYYSAIDGGGTAYPTDGTYTIPSTTTSSYIFVYLTSGTTLNCGVNKGFYVNIGLAPLNATATQCSPLTLPPLFAGSNYYSGPGGTGVIVDRLVKVSQKVYLYAPTNVPSCPAIESSIVVTILAPEIPLALPDITVCGSFILPAIPKIPDNTNITPNQVYEPLFYNTSQLLSGTRIPVGTQIHSSKDIYVCFQSSVDPNCINCSFQRIIINPTPAINTTQAPEVCDKVGYIIPTIPNVNFYTGSQGSGTQFPAGSVLLTSQSVYAYGIIGSCPNELKIDITVQPSKPPTYPIADKFVTVCDSYTLPALAMDGTRCFDTKDGPDAPGFTEYFAGHVFTNSQTVYFYNENVIRANYKCSDGDNPFVITINKMPVITPITNVVSCDFYTLPAIAGSFQANSNVNYFDQSGGLGTKYLLGDKIYDNKTLYVYAETATTPNCVATEKSFTITINKVSQLPAVTACGSYTMPTTTGGTTPTTVEGDYYTETGGPTGTGILIPKGTAITAIYPPVVGTPATMTIRTFYIYKKYVTTEDPSGFCVSETSFSVTIISPPIANDIPLINRTFCDEFDGTNDGLYKQDLTSYSALILNPVPPPANYVPQTGAEFTVSYYSSSTDANANPPLNPITTLTDLQNVWVRVTNTLAPSCFDVKLLQFFINKIPETNPKNGAFCADNVTGLILAPYLLKSELPSAGYSFEWNNSTSTTPIATTNNLSIIVPDTYSVVATDVATGCKSVIKSAVVKQSTKAIATYTLSENFSDNQYVTVDATGGAGGNGGDYVYQLDTDPAQESSLFENVSYGTHTITVIDKNGCGSTPIDIIVVNYPKYFTPNGDGIHDTWNVIGLEKPAPESNIFIYDRYGKLITQVKPYGAGWDGTFNGENLPSTDYWFAVTYLENNTEKVFKAHFTLKR